MRTTPHQRLEGRRESTKEEQIVCRLSGHSVQLCGDFNNWQGYPMERQDDGSFVCYITRDKTKDAQMKFVVDGQWLCDPSYPISRDGGGNENNILPARNNHIPDVNEEDELEEVLEETVTEEFIRSESMYPDSDSESADSTDSIDSVDAEDHEPIFEPSYQRCDEFRGQKFFDSDSESIDDGLASPTTEYSDNESMHSSDFKMSSLKLTAKSASRPAVTHTEIVSPQTISFMFLIEMCIALCFGLLPWAREIAVDKMVYADVVVRTRGGWHAGIVSLFLRTLLGYLRT